MPLISVAGCSYNVGAANGALLQVKMPDGDDLVASLPAIYCHVRHELAQGLPCEAPALATRARSRAALRHKGPLCHRISEYDTVNLLVAYSRANWVRYWNACVDLNPQTNMRANAVCSMW